MKKQYFLILKIVIIIILIAIINYLGKDRTDYYNFPANSYYTDKTYNLQSIYREKIQTEFLDYLDNGQYQKAYNMLSEKSKKNTFSDSEEEFIVYVKDKFFDVGEMSSYNIRFMQHDIGFKEDVTEITYLVNVRENGVNIYLESDKPSPLIKLLEYSPFYYEIEI